MTDAEMWMHRDKLRSTASQVTMWCGIIALHQEDGIGKDRLNKLTQGIMEAENAAALQIVELGMAEASRRLQREMRGICEISFHVLGNVYRHFKGATYPLQKVGAVLRQKEDVRHSLQGGHSMAERNA